MSDEIKQKKVLVIGAGLAGSEAAFYLASRNIPVVLLESKMINPNESQKLKTAAELVCTNSLKSLDPDSSHGLLKQEMKAFDSLILKCAELHRVPAGDALAVDREGLSEEVEKRLRAHPLITYLSEVADDPHFLLGKYQCHYAVIATGPLTLGGLENWIKKEVGDDNFYFYDAIAPIVDAESLDTSQMYFKGRYHDDGEGADYLNVPLTKEQYELFIEALKTAQKVPPKNFEEAKFFEACLPVDLMAERGPETARFSCMKPLGLKTKDGYLPHAVVQLRKENLLGSAYNIVGFQTRLTYKEQLRVFRMLPGFEKAQFLHLGSVHRNSFLDAAKNLNADMSLKNNPHIYFAGQMTGVEGYTESGASGLYVAYALAKKIKGQQFHPFPVTTAIGALINYLLTCPYPRPSNINTGLFPEIVLSREERKSRDRKSIKKALIAQRAQKDLVQYLASSQGEQG